MKLLLTILAVVFLIGLVAMLIWVFVIQDVETPAYAVDEEDGPFEIRSYPELVVAETRRDGVRRDALRRGFSPLARYIFGSDRGGGRIAMTAPVSQIALGGSGETAPPSGPVGWTVRFIMPAEYELRDLPAPGSAAVALREIPAARRAAVRFNGVASDDVIAEREHALRAWLAARGLESTGTAEYAYYNDPLTPGFLRRNEVILDLAAP
ncbi:MAG: heme-binding protein [Pseudomonadota bacterium]